MSAEAPDTRDGPAEAPSVVFRRVTKRYPGADEPALAELDLEVPGGEICVFVGPSGSGKTTAMRMVNRMVEITEGDILVGGTSVRERSPAELRREIGYVIQQIGLFPHRTIADNIATVPRLLGWDRERVEARVEELLELVRIDPELARPLPGPALGRPAAARRRRPRAGRQPRRDADGRALRRGGSDQPRAAPERVPAPAGRGAKDDPVRHPRHRRGDQDGRPGRDPPRGRPPGPVRHPRRAADGARRRLRRGLRRRRPGAEAAGADAGRRHRPLAGAAGLHVGQATSEVRAKLDGAEVPYALVSTPSAGRSAGSPTTTCAPRPSRRARHQPGPAASSSTT